jgi:glyoxylase-like metal-dependent hydrolase (beta-lactamase superfamily II)
VTHESVLIDAPTDSTRILELTSGTTVRYILLTHGDADHIQALEPLRTTLRAPVGIHVADAHCLARPPDFFIEDGALYTFGNVSLRALHTPGHTPGSVCFVVGDILIAGDTLFPGGPGNTRRPEGNFQQIIASIREKLFVLPDDTRVYPGHGKPTTIGAERPHLQEWIDRGW